MIKPGRLQESFEVRFCIECEVNELTPTQKKYCSLKCSKKHCAKRTKINNRIVRENEKPPKWRCDKCGELIQMDFNPTKNSFANIRFDKFKKEHVCK